MGMYDTILISCPDCGGDCSTQSKEGPCRLATYTLDAVDPAIAKDIDGEEVWCETCSKQWVISALKTIKTIPMVLRPWQPSDGV